MIIFLMITIIISFIYLVYTAFEEDKPISCLGYILGGITAMAVFVFSTKNNIDPIEVYRGNTTLEITYRDSIPIDSIVVMKK